MPNDHEHAVCGEVTQADREAAAKIYDLLGFGPCQHIIDGMEDDIGVVAIVARHRIASVDALTAEVERVRAETIEAAAKVAERDAAWTTFAGRGLEQWEDGADGARDYRLGIRVGGIIAAHIRSLAEASHE